jgi:hypothetical protein
MPRQRWRTHLCRCESQLKIARPAERGGRYKFTGIGSGDINHRVLIEICDNSLCL